ncbi:hypothetical protein A6R68_23618 [Neotoma lepida]|uniref:3-oxo-5-alpha-steroid 4-dehydrogenase C-terminal domain-containing protein n=1 Tax=Neotoma lepida TaxID=56216 RepID=A0A1A6HVB1_NEOLE|nr:hypothetical protein A6R68_23618 [Neotoma lepida]
MALMLFVVLSLVSSPYGRYSSKYPGRQVPARLAWFLQELPSMVWPLYECARPAAARLGSLPNRVLLAMFLIHYVQRTLVFPVLIRGGKDTPLVVFASAVLFCTFNGYLQSRYLSQFAVYAEDWVAHPCFLTGQDGRPNPGILIPLMLNHMLYYRELENSRKLHPESSFLTTLQIGSRETVVPHGEFFQTEPLVSPRGLFEYVSAANYFGEIMEWCGFALASWSLQGGVFALFTFSTLFTRAKQHHHHTKNKPGGLLHEETDKVISLCASAACQPNVSCVKQQSQ